MKYFLFLDECGDQNLANFDISFPIFTLCGILISENDYYDMGLKVIDLKKKYWDDKKIILHSRDIRKCEKGFEILFNLDIKKSFYEDINLIMKNCQYTIVSCSVLKESYIRKYGRLSDVYGLSLSYVIERTIFFLDSQEKNDIELHVFAERRGKKEDTSLLNYYNTVLDRGTYFVKSSRIKSYFKKFEVRDKKENIIGLQIADLAAYPITRYVLDNNAVNIAFDLIKGKIYSQGSKQHGLKVFP
jgi:gluconate kinase